MMSKGAFRLSEVISPANHFENGKRDSSCFTWIPPVGQILVLVPRFDHKFVVIFQRHGLSAQICAQFQFKVVSTEAYVSINKLLRE